MKFFLHKFSVNKGLKKIENKEVQPFIESYDYIFHDEDFSIRYFNKFLIKNGLLTKSKYVLSYVFKNFNYFFYSNRNFLFTNYPTQR